MKYHLCVDGTPRPCRAVTRCPFASEEHHYPSESAARAAFEAQNLSFSLPATLEGIDLETLKSFHACLSAKLASGSTDGEEEEERLLVEQDAVRLEWVKREVEALGHFSKSDLAKKREDVARAISESDEAAVPWELTIRHWALNRLEKALKPIVEGPSRV